MSRAGPELDDLAASQQLLDEIACAENTEFSPRLETSFHDASPNAASTPSLHALRQPYLRAPSEDHDAVQDPFKKADGSDSGIEFLSPPTVSARRPGARKNRRVEVDVRNIVLEDAQAGRAKADMATPSSLRPRRKRQHADAAEPADVAKATPTTRKRQKTAPRKSACSRVTASERVVAQDARAEKE